MSTTVTTSRQRSEPGPQFFVPAMNRCLEEAVLIITREDAELVGKVRRF